jgi:molybdopterin converting factor small subunit
MAKVTVTYADEQNAPKTIELDVNGLTLGEVVNQLTNGNVKIGNTHTARVNHEAAVAGTPIKDGDRITAAPKKVDVALDPEENDDNIEMAPADDDADD